SLTNETPSSVSLLPSSPMRPLFTPELLQFALKRLDSLADEGKQGFRPRRPCLKGKGRLVSRRPYRLVNHHVMQVLIKVPRQLFVGLDQVPPMLDDSDNFIVVRDDVVPLDAFSEALLDGAIRLGQVQNLPPIDVVPLKPNVDGAEEFGK